MKVFLLLIFISLTYLQAKVLITPYEAIYNTYGKDVKITKKNILLKSTQAKEISAQAKMKLKTKIYRTFKIEKDAKTIAYGIVTLNKMRTKDAAVLFIIDTNGEVQGIETITFNEPPEFAPSKKWQSQFVHKTKNDTLRVGKDLPTITGATLSARGYSDGARLALAVFEIVFKDK